MRRDKATTEPHPTHLYPTLLSDVYPALLTGEPFFLSAKTTANARTTADPSAALLRMTICGEIEECGPRGRECPPESAEDGAPSGRDDLFHLPLRLPL